MINEQLDRGIKFINDAYRFGHSITVFDLRQVLEAMKEKEDSLGETLDHM